MPLFTHDAPASAPIDAASIDTVHARVADPVVSGLPAGWQVGHAAPPSPLDPVAARAARLEARLAVYAQYAAVVAEEAAALWAGDESRRAALTAARGATAEHFAELRDGAEADDVAPNVFADALTDALHELRHQDAVDDALGRRLRGLRDAAARDAAARDVMPGLVMPALVAGEQPVSRLDLRF